MTSSKHLAVFAIKLCSLKLHYSVSAERTHSHLTYTHEIKYLGSSEFPGFGDLDFIKEIKEKRWLLGVDKRTSSCKFQYSSMQNSVI